MLLFGLDEAKDFSIVGVGDAQRLQEELTHLASADLEPALQLHLLVDQIDGETVVAVEVDEIPARRSRAITRGPDCLKGRICVS